MNRTLNPSAAVQEQAHQNRWLGLLFICVSLLIISLDNTVLNVALPAISRDLGASQSELQWIVDAYILVFAALLLTMGAIGDRIGRKRILQVGIVWFGAFSLVAALATSVEMLVAARAMLGFGGAIIMPATLSLVTSSFRDPKERAQAIAIWAAVFGLGIGVGPLLGGYLLQDYEWNAVFLVNLPVVLVALIGGHFFLEESRDENAPSPDYPGVLLSITGLFALVYGIIEAGVKGWEHDSVLFSLGLAGVILTTFFWWKDARRRRCCRCTCSATLVHGRERGDRVDDVRHVRDLLLDEPVLPVGARLHRAGSGHPAVPHLDCHHALRDALGPDRQPHWDQADRWDRIPDCGGQHVLPVTSDRS